MTMEGDMYTYRYGEILYITAVFLMPVMLYNGIASTGESLHSP